jgi:hypothetical protein
VARGRRGLRIATARPFLSWAMGTSPVVVALDLKVANTMGEGSRRRRTAINFESPALQEYLAGKAKE